MPQTSNQNSHVESPLPLEAAQEQIERERLTRRQALKKFGVTSAMAAFALLSVDDLAHAVCATMTRRASDQKVAGQVAQEFHAAGVAFTGQSTVYGKGCTCNPYCNGDCTCLCLFDFCVTERQLCNQYPACCDNACQPIGSVNPVMSAYCAAYNKGIADAQTRQTQCESNPANYGHAGCI